MKNKGFTLIEVMVVTALIGIMTAYAVTSYSKYASEQKENLAKAKMQELQIELQNYKLTNLTYKGFGTQSVVVYLGNNSKIVYTINLVDSKDNKALSSTTSGREWTMLATPKDSADKWLMVNSNGKRCMGGSVAGGDASNVSLTTCPRGSETW